MFDDHFTAAVNLIGLTLGVIGGLYLAYDLLGSKHGWLRIITRALTYGLLFAITYALFLGIKFGLIAATGMGLILGIELIHVSPDAERTPANPYLLATLRGTTLALAIMCAYDAQMGILFGVLFTIALSLVYRFRFSPSATYESSTRPKLTRPRFIASLARGAAATACGAIAGALSAPGVWIGLKIGIIIGVASLFLGIFSPVVEWRVNNLTEREMGAIGIFLILIGFIFQSLESWLRLFGLMAH